MKKNTLKWKKELPTRPGWYWIRTPGWKKSEVDTRVVYVRNYVGELAIDNSAIKGWHAMEQAEWAGPLQEPTA